LHPMDVIDIKHQLIDICHSSVLDGAPLRREMLRHIVDATLAGEPATERSIAISVYRKDHTFEPAIEGIVRGEKRKLIKALDRYYEEEGLNAPIRITISGYVALWERRNSHAPSPQSGTYTVADGYVWTAPHPSCAGVYVTRLDEKHRLVLPRDLLRQDERTNTDTYYLTTVDRKMIRIYSMAWLAPLMRSRTGRRIDWGDGDVVTIKSASHPWGVDVAVDFEARIRMPGVLSKWGESVRTEKYHDFEVPVTLRELAGLDHTDLCLWRSQRFVALAPAKIWAALWRR